MAEQDLETVYDHEFIMDEQVSAQNSFEKAPQHTNKIVQKASTDNCKNNL